jgi:hypothetical protein
LGNGYVYIPKPDFNQERTLFPEVVLIFIFARFMNKRDFQKRLSGCISTKVYNRFKSADTPTFEQL